MSKRVTGPDGLVVEFPDDADEATIKQVMSETYAARQTQQVQQPSQPADRTARTVDVPREESGLVNFGRGLQRLPDAAAGAIPVVGDALDAARGTPGRSREAAATFGRGATRSLEAAGRGVLKPFGRGPDMAIAAISEGMDAVTGRDTGSFGEKVERSRQYARELEEENPLSSFVGMLYGFGRTGAALRNVAAKQGVTVGIGGEAAALAGASSLAEGNDPSRAATDALIGMAGGKVAQGVLDRVVSPAVKYVAGRLNPALRGDGDLSAGVVNNIANRTNQSADDVRLAVAAFREANGYTPSLAEIADPQTIQKFAQLARERQNVAGVFREAEESAAAARPERMAAAVEDTGPIARGAEEVSSVEEAARTATRGVQEGRDRAVAETVDEATRQRRMVSEESRKLIDAEKTAAGRAGEELRQEILEMTRVPDDMATPKAIDDSIKEWADFVMRAPRTGLAKQKVDIPVEVVERTIPIPAMQRALKNMLDATPQRTTKFKRIRKAMENLDGKKPIRLTVDELDSLRRSFANMVDDAGVRYDLGDASKALTEVAERQLPEYAEFVKKYAQLQRAAEGFKTGRGVLTEGPNTARVDIAGLDAYGRAGATRGAMTRINEAFTTTPEPVKVAAQISARRDAIIEAMGPQGRQLVEAAETAMNRVQTIADEIAEITEAARNTREGLSDAAKRRVRQLRQAAKKEAEAINSKFVRDRAALRAADEVLSQRSSNFAAATEGADPNLPLGAVARGSVADTARQSPADALRTAERLRDTSTRQRIGAVAGEDTAARLAEVGAGQTRAAANLSRAAVRGPNDMPISEEVSAALEIAATLTGRAGAGFAANAIRRQLIRSNTLSLSENQATALARAVTSNDPAVVSQLIDRLGKTQAQRQLIEQTLGRIAVSLGAVLPSTRGEGSETDQAIRDLVANGYSRAEAEEIVSYTP